MATLERVRIESTEMTNEEAMTYLVGKRITQASITPFGGEVTLTFDDRSCVTFIVNARDEVLDLTVRTEKAP